MALDPQSPESSLLLQIQEMLRLSMEEISAKQELAEQTRQTLDKANLCLSDINIQLAKMKSEQHGFHMAWRDKVSACDVKHTDFEHRLRCSITKEDAIMLEKYSKDSATQLGERIEIIEVKVDKRMSLVEIKVDNLIPLLYKIVGGVIVIAILVPPLLTALFGILANHFGWGPPLPPGKM